MRLDVAKKPKILVKSPFVCLNNILSWASSASVASLGTLACPFLRPLGKPSKAIPALAAAVLRSAKFSSYHFRLLLTGLAPADNSPQFVHLLH